LAPGRRPPHPRRGGPRCSRARDRRRDRSQFGLVSARGRFVKPERRRRPPEEPALSGQRLVLGLQPVRELVRRHGSAVTEVLVQEGDSPRLEALARFAQDQGARCRRVSGAELDRLSRGTRHQGVAAYGPPLVLTPLAELLAPPYSCESGSV